MTGFLLLIEGKSNNHDTILVINYLIKIVYYNLVKININATNLSKIITNIIIKYHDLPKSIISNLGLLFTLRFWSLLY